MEIENLHSNIALFGGRKKGMQVTLKVVDGKNDGRQIAISIPEFIIGRGDKAHLKPSSDLVSRNHCLIKTEEGKVIVSDMGSRNGTFLNGEKLTAPHVAQVGDQLRVGRLQFEIIIDHAVAGSKKPKVQDVVEAAARTAKSPSKPQSLEDSITDWLADDDDDVELDTFTKEALSNADTVQFKLDETSDLTAKSKEETADEKSGDESTDKSDEDSEEDSEEVVVDGKKKKKKKTYGKLPPVPKFSHDDSTTAADDVLRKFFNRR